MTAGDREHRWFEAWDNVTEDDVRTAREFFAGFAEHNKAKDPDGAMYGWCVFTCKMLDALTAARREREEARETNRRLNLRCQQYERALAEKVSLCPDGKPKGSALSRSLLNGLCEMQRADIERLTAERDEAEQRGRAAERADVVAYLRNGPGRLWSTQLECNGWAAGFESGCHVGAAGKGEA